MQISAATIPSLKQVAVLIFKFYILNHTAVSLLSTEKVRPQLHTAYRKAIRFAYSLAFHSLFTMYSTNK